MQMFNFSTGDRVLSAILVWAFLLLTDSPPGIAQELSRPDSNDIYQSGYLARWQKANPDTTDFYKSRSYPIFAIPRLFFSGMIYPLGKLTVHAERGKIAIHMLNLFMNEDRTFGFLPQITFGGETGTGGGGRIFHSNIAGKGKQFDALMIYSGGRGQMGEAMYMDPSVADGRIYLTTEVGYLRTRNRNANINAAVRDDPTRIFRIDQMDLLSIIGWRLNAGPLEPYKKNFYLEGILGTGKRDFRQLRGPTIQLRDTGSTPQARLLNGLEKEFWLHRFGGRVRYDGRDYREPTDRISHPLNYRFPGRNLTYEDGRFHHYRDLSYPENGGLIELDAEFVTGSKDFQFIRMGAEVQGYLTLFWRNRILMFQAQLEKLYEFRGGEIPYTDLVQLGGSTQFRGYRRGFFRGEGSLLLNLEYRYPIWDTWNAYIFWEEGQIFDNYDQIEMDRFHTSWGGGISIRTETALLGKVFVAHSDFDKVRIGFSMGLDF